MNWKEKQDPYILFFFSFVALCSVLWIREADIMEARNFISAREMIHSHDWWTTSLNGNLRFEKPPLPTWITALWMQLIHNQSTEALLRIPNALFTACFSVFYYFKMKEIFKNRDLAFYSSFVLATTFIFIKTAAENTWDIYTYSCAFAAGLSYLHYLKTGLRKEMYLFSCFVALSVLSKGPVGIYSTLLPAIFATLITDFSSTKNKGKEVLFFLFLGILVGSIWALSMYLQSPAYFSEVMEKEKNTWSQLHTHGFFFYLDYIFYVGTWFFFFLFSFFSTKATKEEKTFYFWHILSLFFLSIVQMKKKRYGMPLYFTMSSMLGFFIRSMLQKSWSNYSKKEKGLFQAQKYLLLGIILLSICFLSYCYFVKGFLSGGLYFLFILFYLGSFRSLFLTNTSENFPKKIIFWTGGIVLLFNLTTAWLVDVYFLKNSISFQTKFSPEIRKSSLPVYSRNFEIEDVWKVGKKIRSLHSLPTENTILQFGTEGLQTLLPHYKIEKEFIEERGGQKIYIYELQRKEQL